LNSVTYNDRLEALARHLDEIPEGTVTTSIGIATCAEFPALDAEGRLLLDALDNRGFKTIPIVWNAEYPWDELDAVILRSTWDYQFSISRFLTWSAKLGKRLFNAPQIVTWNIDKRYLFELKEHGISVVATQYLPPGGEFALPGGQFVVKPAISAGSKDTATYNAERLDEAIAQIHELHKAGRSVLIQPYYHRIDTDAETAVIIIDGEVSHCMRKEALLRLDQPLEEGLFRQEEMSVRNPEADVIDVARAACELVSKRFGQPLYARVDVLRNDSGQPEVLELELVEPCLFLDFAPGSADQLADALIRRAALA
jgi:glutathione synthase/RimK-type ligase-like ATP-grasp enzyme